MSPKNPNHTTADWSPEDKIRAWLDLTRNEEGHLHAGDWMASIVPHLDILSVSESMPHPSVVFTYTVQPDHCNRLGNLHGGAAASIFDFCTTLPLALVCQPGFWQFMGVSRSLNVTYLRPARCGEQFLIECHIVQIGKRLSTLHGVMKRKQDGQIMSLCEHGKVNIDGDAKL